MTTLAAAWRHGGRMVAVRPLSFSAALVLYSTFFMAPLAAGLLLREIFNLLSHGAAVDARAWTLIVFIIGVDLSRISACYFGQWALHSHTIGSGMSICENLLRWLMSGPGPKRAPSSTGEAVNCLSDDVPAVVSFVQTWIELPGQIVCGLTATIIMAFIEPTITCMVVIPLVAAGVATKVLASRLHRYRSLAREATADVASFMGEIFAAAQAVRIAGAEERVVTRLDHLNDQRRRATVLDRTFETLLQSALAHTSGIVQGLVLLFAAGLMRKGSFTVGDFILFASYISLLAPASQWAGILLTRKRQAQVSIARLDGLMHDAPPATLTALASPAVVREFEPLRQLTVHSLTCIHEGSGRGVEGIDLSLAQGTLTVVAGRVGAGKTTLIRALLGLQARQRGEIAWNGRLIEDPASFMAPPLCAYTPQAPRLFSETLKDNILMGQCASMAELETAIALAVLDEDLAQLGEGVDTPVGPRGVTLSGGQLQRAAAARMLVRRPQLTVLDDASSALDVETEHMLWDRLLHAGDRTILAVSHRREAFRRADQIVVLDEGRVAARGPADTLLSQSALFRELWSRG